MQELSGPGWPLRPSNKSPDAAREPDSARTMTRVAANGARAERPMLDLPGKVTERNCGSARLAKSAPNYKRALSRPKQEES